MYSALPQWKALPQIDLYLDQVLIYVNQTLNLTLDTQTTYLSASMVNNYVKLGLLPKAQKKRYQPRHLAYLIVISLLKTCFSIQDISSAIEALLKHYEGPDLYNHFSTGFNYILVENRSFEATSGPLDIVNSACFTLKHHQQTIVTLNYLQEQETAYESKL